MILSLETSGNVCSVAVHEAGRLLKAEELHERQAHAAMLAVMVDSILKSPETHGKQIEAVAVSSGPGSYTGLRIGTSTAKGICFALSVPLIAVSSLDILIGQLPEGFENAWLCPMIDARRMEVYTKLVDSSGNIIHDVEARIIDESSYQNFLIENRIVFFGDGAMKCREIINHPNAVFVDQIFPTANALGKLAFKKFNASEVEDLVHFEPFYLKEFIAKKPSRSLI